MSYADIGREMNISPNAVSGKITRLTNSEKTKHLVTRPKGVPSRPRAGSDVSGEAKRGLKAPTPQNEERLSADENRPRKGIMPMVSRLLRNDGGASEPGDSRFIHTPEFLEFTDRYLRKKGKEDE